MVWTYIVSISKKKNLFGVPYDPRFPPDYAALSPADLADLRRYPTSPRLRRTGRREMLPGVYLLLIGTNSP